ncbi:hypothetical protein HWI79_3676 [Cryptosporidium felis]|nr:hypothetical protein HWI79_3676 [Cryptosporidium felis]
MSQSSVLWNSGYSGELLLDQSGSMDWIGSDECMEPMKGPGFQSFSTSNPEGIEALGNGFYDCAGLDDGIHSYMFKGLLGEGVGEDPSCAGYGLESGLSAVGEISGIHSFPGQSGASGGCGEGVREAEGTRLLVEARAGYSAVPQTNGRRLEEYFQNGTHEGGGSQASPVEGIQEGLFSCTPTTASLMGSATPRSFIPSLSGGSDMMGMDPFHAENAQKRARMDSDGLALMGVLDDAPVSGDQSPGMGVQIGLGMNQNLDLGPCDVQIAELDSGKGRRWSNNSTTSTISSGFSVGNNGDSGGLVHPGNVGVCASGDVGEGVGRLGSHSYQQEQFCPLEGVSPQEPKVTRSSGFEIGAPPEEEHFPLGSSLENEFFLNSDTFLSDEEKLKLRRRGRRRRPGMFKVGFLFCGINSGEIEAWKTIIPRTTVDEAEHFVQTSQYRMRHVYRDPRAVSFVYRTLTTVLRCVQHVDCQYEMRIYLLSHETCYVQHRGYHTEEKQKYKRPDLPRGCGPIQHLGALQANHEQTAIHPKTTKKLPLTRLPLKAPLPAL